MHRQIAAVITAVVLALWPVRASAASGGQVLVFPVSAKAVALAEACTAWADDAFAASFNPAGLNQAVDSQLGMTYLRGFADTYFTHLAFTTPLGQEFGLGASLSFLDAGRLRVEWPDGRVQDLSAQQDLVASLAGGLRVNDHQQVGLAVKILHSRLAETYSGLALALDAGALFALDPDLMLGFAIKNLGTVLKYDEEGDPLPAVLSLGLGYTWRLSPGDTVRVGLDLKKPLDAEPEALCGVEYQLADLLSLRAGVQYGPYWLAWSAGAGFQWSLIRVDYALAHRGELGLNHYVSVMFRW